MPPIIFVRHGETSWNAEGRLQGQRDIPLTDKGRGQARRNGETIAAAFPDLSAYGFVASPLSRARETMEIARRAIGLDPAAYALDDRLMELTFGDWEGFTTAELRTKLPAAIAEREHDKWAFVPPGGESYAMLSDRVGGWLAGLDRPTFVVAHGGVGRVRRRLALGLDPEAVVVADFPQDKVMLIEDGTERWI